MGFLARLAPTTLGPLATLLGVGALVASLVAGCGADHAAPPEDPDAGQGDGGEGNDIKPRPVFTTGGCTTGEVKDCTVYSYVGDTQNCFIGLQLCVDGEWDDVCRSQEDLDDLIAELGYDSSTETGGGGASGEGGSGTAGSNGT